MKRAVRRIIKRNGGRKAPFAFPGSESKEVDAELCGRVFSFMEGMVKDNRLLNIAENSERETVVNERPLRVPYRSFFPAPGIHGHMDAKTVGDMLKWMGPRGMLRRVSRHTQPYELRYMAIVMMCGTNTSELTYLDGDRVIKIDNDGRGEEQVWFCLAPFWKTPLWNLACALAQRLDDEGVMTNRLIDERETAMNNLPELKEDDNEAYRDCVKQDWNRPWFREVVKSMKVKRDLRAEIDKAEITDHELLSRLNFIETTCRDISMSIDIPDAISQRTGCGVYSDNWCHPIMWGNNDDELTRGVSEQIESFHGEMSYFYDFEVIRIRDGILTVTNNEDKYADRAKVRLTVDACQNLMKKECVARRRLTSIIK